MTHRGRNGGARLTDERRKWPKWRTPERATSDGARLKQAWALAFAIAFVAPATIPLSARPSFVAPPGQTAPPGFVTSDDLFFVQVGSPIFGLAFNPVSNGSQIFTAYLTVVLYPLTNVTHTARLDLYRAGPPPVLPFTYTSIAVNPNSTATVELPVPQSSHYIEMRLVVDQTTRYYWTETPIEILPIAGLLVGGVDLVAVIALTEFLVIGLPLMALARRLARRAVHAPRVKAILWLHGIVLSGLAYWILNFPSLNVYFGGWEWLVFPLPTMAFLFFWELGRHNRDEEALVVRGNPRNGHRLGMDLWKIHVAKDRQGNLELIGQFWRDTFYRIAGVHVRLYHRKNDTVQLEPVPAELARRSTTETIDRLRALFDPKRGSGTEPTDDFEITNRDLEDEDGGTALLFWVDSADPWEIEWPKLSWHRTEKVPAKLSKNGEVVIAEHEEPRLCRPYWTSGKAVVRLGGIHYADVVAVALGWKESEELVRVIEELTLENFVLKARLQILAHRKAAVPLAAHLDLISRFTDDLSPEDAAAYVETKRGGAPPEAPGSEEPTPEGGGK